jgi:hypothetical protein
LELYFYSSHIMSFAWSVLYYMSLCFVCFLVCHNHLCWTHLFERATRLSWFVRILYVLHLYLLSYAVALVLNLNLFKHGGGYILKKYLNSHASLILFWELIRLNFEEIFALSWFTYILLRVDNSNGNLHKIWIWSQSDEYSRGI